MFFKSVTLNIWRFLLNFYVLLLFLKITLCKLFKVFVCKKYRQIQMRQILASFSQGMKSSSKQ